MKTLKFLFAITALLLVTDGHAQFFKKLKKKAAEAAERTVERKVEEKTEKETEKAFDSTFNNQGNLFKKSNVAPSDFYSFTHKYVMEVSQGKDTTQLMYYLASQGNYLGSSVQMKENEQMVTVMDLSRKTAYSFMDFGDMKTMMSFGLDFEEIVENTQDNNSEMIIEPTGNTKEILSYNCS